VIIESLRTTTEFHRLAADIPGPGSLRTLAGLGGSSPAVLAAALVEAGAVRSLLLVAPTAPAAEEVEADLEALVPGRARVFPQRESVHPDLADPHIEISARRVDALQAIIVGRSRILVTTGRALGERFTVPASWADLEIRLEPQQELDRDTLLVDLDRAGYKKVSMVEAVGEYSVRGGIIDIYPITTLDPVRLEFWGDRIESVRSFDILDQRSIAHLESVRLLPVTFPGQASSGPSEADVSSQTTGNLLELLPETTLVLQIDTDKEEDERRRSWDELRRRTETPQSYQDDPEAARSKLDRFGRLCVVPSQADADLDFAISATPIIDRRIDRLIAAVREAAGTGARVLILCDNEGQLERLEEIIADAASRAILRQITLGLGPLAAGFVLAGADPPLWIFTAPAGRAAAPRPPAGQRWRRSRPSQPATTWSTSTTVSVATGDWNE